MIILDECIKRIGLSCGQILLRVSCLLGYIVVWLYWMSVSSLLGYLVVRFYCASHTYLVILWYDYIG